MNQSRAGGCGEKYDKKSTKTKSRARSCSWAPRSPTTVKIEKSLSDHNIIIIETVVSDAECVCVRLTVYLSLTLVAVGRGKVGAPREKRSAHLKHGRDAFIVRRKG